MYENNSRDSSKIKGFSPLQLSRKLKVWSPAVGYYSYTNRCASLKTNKQNESYNNHTRTLKKQRRIQRTPDWTDRRRIFVET